MENMTNKTKAAMEEAADKYERKYDGISAMDYTAGMQEVIEHPERYGLTARKSLGIQEARELVNQMMAEEISFSRFVELINEGGTK